MANRGRQPVAQGGLWNSQKATYSKETHQLLKDMMKESKLTNFQQRELDKAMNSAGTLPLRCHPTSSAKQKPKPPTQSPSKIVDPRKHSSKIRTRDDIEATGAYERDRFVPLPQTFYEKDKERLANMMAYGEDIAPPEKPKIVRPVEKDPFDIDRFDELQAEITERRQFLERMENVGKGDAYRSIIATEISQKIREMEVIDQKRTAELERMIAEDEKKKSQSK